MPTPYTKKAFIERLKRDLSNNFPDSDFSISDNEILFHIDQALASTMVGQAYNLAKIEGNLVMPEAYITTYSIGALTKDDNTNYWYATLPQPPVSLPLGYSITNVYFAASAYGQSDPVWPIENKRVSYRRYLPMPNGSRYWVEGNRIWVVASNGASLYSQNLYVTMAKTRTTDVNEAMDLPDDAIDMIYTMAMDKLRRRILNPQDSIQDFLPANAKTQ